MTKLEMAHDWYMKHGEDNHMEQSIKLAFGYADAMQAEAEKREQESSDKASKEINDILENHEHIFVDGRICWCGKIKSDIEAAPEYDPTLEYPHDAKVTYHGKVVSIQDIEGSRFWF